MDERRFRVALDTLSETISDYGEDTIFAALGVIAEQFGWELSKRDPGPECEYDDWYARHGIMAPIHSCPHDAPDSWEQLEATGHPEASQYPSESDTSLVHRAFGLPAFPRRW